MYHVKHMEMISTDEGATRPVNERDMSYRKGEKVETRCQPA